MSSCPGYTLEEFLAWEYNLIVENLGEVNFSIGVAEALGNIKHTRPILTEEQFKKIVDLFEPYREDVTMKLLDYEEEDHGSWRDYATYNFDFIPNEVYDKATALVKELKNECK